MTEIADIHVRPRIEGDAVSYVMATHATEGNWEEHFVFSGRFRDERDFEIARILAAFPDLVGAAASAMLAIRMIHTRQTETGSGNAVVDRLYKARMLAESDWAGLIEMVTASETLFVVDDALAARFEGTGRQLLDAVHEGRLQVEYLLQKFGMPSDEKGWLEHLDAVIFKAEEGPFVFHDDNVLRAFEKWSEDCRQRRADDQKKYGSR